MCAFIILNLIFKKQDTFVLNKYQKLKQRISTKESHSEKEKNKNNNVKKSTGKLMLFFWINVVMFGFYC